MMRMIDGVYEKIGEIALLIAKLNQIATHHVGYCGENAEEIAKILSVEWGKSTFAQYATIAYEDNKIIGLLILDVDDEENSAELWGPFIDTDDYETWCKIATEIWNYTIYKQKNPKMKLSSFYNVHNQNAITWVEQWNTSYQGEYLILTMNQAAKVNFENSADQFIQPDMDLHIQDVQILSEPIRTEFQTLHQKAFGDTYYNVDDIQQRLSTENKLFLLVHQQVCIGYVYIESDHTFKEGNIEYIAIYEKYRGQGYGTLLLHQALHYLFQCTPTEEVTLCVDSAKVEVIGLYCKLGFSTKYQLRRSTVYAEEAR